MPKCRYCHESISRLDKDVCPFCGGTKPLSGVSDQTMDITKVFDPEEMKAAKVAPRSKKIAGVLAIFLGFLGIDEHYLYSSKKGLLMMAISLAFIGGLGSLLFFVAMDNVLAYLIPYFVLEFYFLAKGIVLFTSNTIKDGRGEFLK